jgi:hypothetical protein
VDPVAAKFRCKKGENGMLSSRIKGVLCGIPLLAAVGAGMAACHAPVAHAPLAVPARLGQEGEGIYFGEVFPKDGAASQPTFVYERRVAARGRSWVSSHVTRRPRGEVALAEEAVHDSRYALARYDLFTNQRGQRGSIQVQNGNVYFRLVEGAREETAVEDQPDLPVLVGPTLVGYVVQHLPALRTGQRLGVRLALLERLETLGFELESVPAPRGQTRVRMRPSSLLVRLAVNPVIFSFDTATSKLLRLEGPVPTKLPTPAGLQDFDARVEYRFVAPRYR